MFIYRNTSELFFFNIYVFISILISINSFALYVFWLEALDLFQESIDEKGCVQYCIAQYFNMEMENKMHFCPPYTTADCKLSELYKSQKWHISSLQKMHKEIKLCHILASNSHDLICGGYYSRNG